MVSWVRSSFDHVTGELLVAPFLTVTRPAAFAGTTAVRCVELLNCFDVAATVPAVVPLPPKKTALKDVKPTPVIVIEVPALARFGVNPVIPSETVKFDVLK